MVVKVNPHSQPAKEPTPSKDEPIAVKTIKTKLQQKASHNPHKGHPGAPSLGDQRDCTTDTHRMLPTT